MTLDFGSYQQFYYTVAKISATWIGLVFVAMTIYISNLRTSLQGFPLNLAKNSQFPYYLINIIVVDLITLAIPLFIVFINFGPYANYYTETKSLALVVFILSIAILSNIITLYHLLRVKLSALLKVIGYLRFFRVILSPMIIIFSLTIILCIDKTYYSEWLPVITISFLVFGLGITFLDTFIFRAEKIFLKFDQGVVSEDIDKENEKLINKIKEIRDSVTQEEKKELDDFISYLQQFKDKMELLKKSNIINVGDMTMGMEYIGKIKEKYKSRLDSI